MAAFTSEAVPVRAALSIKCSKTLAFSFAAQLKTSELKTIAAILNVNFPKKLVC